MGKVTTKLVNMLFKYHRCLALKKKLVRPLLRRKKNICTQGVQPNYNWYRNLK